MGIPKNPICSFHIIDVILFPYIIISIFAGSFVDKHKKKHIIVIADTIAALCSLTVLILLVNESFCIWHIYAVNLIIGFMNSFQSPAMTVAMGILVPEKKYDKASGMKSFSTNIVTVSAPMLAAAVLPALGINGIILIDLSSFLFAMLILIFFVVIKEDNLNREVKESAFGGFKQGLKFLKGHKGVFYIMLIMALMNFFSRITYENILTPMLIARSGGGTIAYGIVSAILGIGEIIGGAIVSTGFISKNRIKTIFFSAAFSFLFGDLLMGIGRNVYMWSIAGLAASIPIPFVLAGQSVILYETVPREIQGRVFAVRNAIQFSTIPVGILLGGIWADYIFEPFMASNNAAVEIFEKIVGHGQGSGMALMFLITGIMGSAVCVIGYFNKEIRKLEK